MPSCSKNITFSSNIETSLASQKQSFPIEDPQYHVAKVGQKSLRSSNSLTTDTMVATIQFSIPLTPYIGTSNGSLHCLIPIRTLQLLFESQIEIVSPTCIFSIMFSPFLNIIYLHPTFIEFMDEYYCNGTQNWTKNDKPLNEPPIPLGRIYLFI
jgi:hypothetical protein